MLKQNASGQVVTMFSAAAVLGYRFAKSDGSIGAVLTGGLNNPFTNIFTISISTSDCDTLGPLTVFGTNSVDVAVAAVHESVVANLGPQAVIQ